MSGRDSDNVRLCRKWYATFESRDLDTLMTLFTDDVVVVVGAGGSSSAVAYSGTYTGQDEVRRFYEKRFAGGYNLQAPIRPLCAVLPTPSEYGPWVLFWGQITDSLPDRSTTYQGGFLHVFRVDAMAGKIASLDMFLEPSGLVPQLSEPAPTAAVKPAR